MNELQKICICDGINLYYIQDDKYKTVSVSMCLHRPVSRGEVTKNSLLAGVLKAGTGRYPAMKDINRHLEKLYGTAYDITVSRKGGTQTLTATFSVIDEKVAGENVLPDVFDMMFEFMFNPATENGGFVKKIVQTEKKNLKESIEGIINDKRAYASIRCLEEMCKDESAGISEYGYVEDLEQIDEKNLYEHYSSIITESPIDIFVVGMCDIDSVAKNLTEGFSKIQFNIASANFDIVKADSAGNNNVEEKFDVVQGKLVMGLRTFTDFKDDLYYPLLVGNSIFGAGSHSKLFNNVREKSSLAYYVSSKLDKYSEIMLISSGIEFANFERAKTEILNELDKVVAGDFTAEEEEKGKRFLISQFRSYYDNPYAMKDFYLGQMLYGEICTVEEVVDKINKVTKEQITEAFSKIVLDTVYFLKGRE